MRKPTRRLAIGIAAAPLLAAQKSPAPKRYPFEYWDVFTERRFTGNPLAVFTSADGLAAEQMRAIAGETNLSETTFVFRRSVAEEKTKGVRTRIFTPVTEYDFAGHPALGTAFSLWKPGVTRVVLDLNIGPVPVDLRAEGGKLYGVMVQPQPVLGEVHDPAVIAKLIGLPLSDLDTRHPIQNVSTGRPNLIVMLKSLKAIRALRIDWNAVADYFAAGDKARSFYFLTAETENGARYHARKLTPRTEDPVTGSAAGSAIAWLVNYGLVGSGEGIVIEQGSEVSRPGKLYVSAEMTGSSLTDVQVGGYGVKSWSGEMPAFYTEAA